MAIIPLHEASVKPAGRDVQFGLKIAIGTLVVLNLVALFLYLAPPGGSKEDLMRESTQLQNQIAATRAQNARMSITASKVQTGNVESGSFEERYFLPKRQAYVAVIEEIQRMAQNSGMQERDGANSEEPIEGTADLSLLSATASYEGNYANLMKFLYEVDRSPMLLILDALTAAPQQKGGMITAQIRFQAVIREATQPVTAGGRP